jgi:hypothetical protein
MSEVSGDLRLAAAKIKSPGNQKLKAMMLEVATLFDEQGVEDYPQAIIALVGMLVELREQRH